MFFGIGFWECLLILLVALVVFPPKRLPELAQSVGKCISYLKRFTNNLKNEI